MLPVLRVFSEGAYREGSQEEMQGFPLKFIIFVFFVFSILFEIKKCIKLCRINVDMMIKKMCKFS